MRIWRNILTAGLFCSLVLGTPAAFASKGYYGQGEGLTKVDGQMSVDKDNMPDYPPADDDGFGGGGNDDGPDSTDDGGYSGGSGGDDGYGGGSGSDPDGSGGGLPF